MKCSREIEITGSLLDRWAAPGTPVGPWAVVRHAVVAGDVIAEVDRAEAACVRVLLVVIESNGGGVVAAFEVAARLRRFSEAGGRVVAFLPGRCVSSAPVVAVAADVIVMAPGAAFGLHGGDGPGAAATDEAVAAVLADRTAAPIEWLRERFTSPGLGGLDAAASLRLGWADMIGSLDDARRIANDLAAGLPLPDSRRSRWNTARGLAAAATVLACGSAACGSSDGPIVAVPTYDAEARLHEVAASAWLPATGGPASSTFTSIESNGADTVAVGYLASDSTQGRCARSTDGGITYSSPTIGTPSNAIVWDPAHSVFIAIGAVGTTGKCSTSPTGATWSPQTMPTGSWSAIATDGAGLVVAVGVNVAATSTDGGANWTTRTIPAGNYGGVAWTGAGFVAVGGDGGSNSHCATSTSNGVTWTSRTLPSGSSFTDVAWNGGDRVAAVGYGIGAWSLNGGQTWTASSIGSTSFLAVVWSGAVWVATGTGTTATSRDGETWTTRSPALPSTIGLDLGIASRRAVGCGITSGLAYSIEW